MNQNNKLNIAVVLSGCGVYDGSEINEAVLTLLALGQNNAGYRCLAPHGEQRDVVNHQTGAASNTEKRNILAESARIARGEIDPLEADSSAAQYDALIVPGGFGVVKNLCNYALEGRKMSLNDNFAGFARQFIAAGKPVGLVCIAPVMAPLLYDSAIRCTIGSDADTAADIEAMGGIHQNCPVDGIVADQAGKLVTTPAYMLASSPAEAFPGISLLVKKVLESV